MQYKKNKLVACVIVMSLIVFGGCIYYGMANGRHWKNNNDKSVVQIENVEVNPITEYDVDAWFREFKWNEKINKRIKNTPNEYFMICLTYTIKNFSPTAVMKDVRIYPHFSSGIGFSVETFNSGNGTYKINIESDSLATLKQYIVVKKGKLYDNRIYEHVLDQDFTMEYYLENISDDMKLGEKVWYNIFAWGKQKNRYAIEHNLVK